MPRSVMTVLVALLIALPSLAVAQPLADRLPDDTLVYIGWSGQDNFGQAYENTHMQELMTSTEAVAFMGHFANAVSTMTLREDPRAAAGIAHMQTVASVAWHRPAAFYFGGIDRGPNGQPLPKVAFIFDAGDREQALVAALQALAQNDPQVARALNITTQHGLVVVTPGPAPQSLTAALSGQGQQSLAKKQAFTQSLGALAKQPAAAMWVDVQGVLAAIESQMPPQEVAEWRQFKQAAGLEGAKHAGVTGSFSGKMWQVDAFIAAPQPRQGLLAMLDGQPLDDATLSVAPQSAAIVNAVRLDPYELFTGIKQLAVTVNPQAEQQYTQVRQQIQEMFGFDVEDDLLKGLGDQWVAYSDASVTGSGGLTMVATTKLRDPQGVARALASIEQVIKSMLDQQLAQAAQQQGGPPKIQTPLRITQHKDLEMHSFSLLMITPTWAIAGDRLYVGLYPQVVYGAHRFTQSKQPSILENDAFNAARKQLDAQQASSLQYADLKQTLPNAYSSMLLFSHMLSTVSHAQGLDANVMLVPPIAELQQHIAPIAAGTWSDEAGWHWRSRSPFPGSSTLASGVDATSISSMSMMVGVVLPALGAARRTSRQMQANTQLRGVHSAMHLYAAENDGMYPPDIATLVLDGYVSPEYVLSPWVEDRLPAGFAQWDPQQKRQWINQNASFVMLKMGEKAPPMNNRAAVAGYLRPDHAGSEDGFSIVFEDNSVAWKRVPEARRILENAGVQFRH